MSQVFETLQKIINAIKRTEHIDTIQNFANLQNLLTQYGHRNILLLATQAKKLDIKLNDVRTVNTWLNDEINPSAIAQPLHIYSQDTNNQIKRVAAYDISQTDAPLKGIQPKAQIIQIKNAEEILNKLFNHINNLGHINITKGLTTNYYPHAPAITINQNETIEEQINTTIKLMIKESVFGNSIRKNPSIQTDSHLNNAVLKITTNSILNRFTIDNDLTDNQLNFEEKEALFENVDKSLESISTSIKAFNKEVKLNEFINTVDEPQEDYEKKFNELLDELEKQESKQTKEIIKQKPTRKRIEFKKIDDLEADKLKKETLQLINESNPEQLLTALGYDAQTSNGGYKIRRYGESKASTFIDYNGAWLFHSKQTDVGGNMVKLAMLDAHDTEVRSYKEAIEFCCDVYNVPNLFQIELDNIQRENELLKQQYWGNNYKPKIDTDKKNISTDELREKNKKLAEELKMQNEATAKEHKTHSRVTKASKIIPDKFKEMLFDRGITEHNIDKFYYIEGESWSLDENSNPTNIKHKKGVGVLCAQKEYLSNVFSEFNNKDTLYFNEDRKSENFNLGADIHFPPYTIPNTDIVMKTQSFGPQTVSTFIDNLGSQSSSYCAAESKMDYAATNKFLNFKENKIDVDIANSVNNANVLGENIAQNKYENILFLNQFDVPGIEFLVNIHKHSLDNGYEIPKFKYIEYKDEEYKQDPNDLIKNNIDIYSRLKNGNVNTIQKLIDQARDIEDIKENENLQKNLDRIETKLKDIKQYIKPQISTTQKLK